MILTRLIDKCLHFKFFSSGLILGGHECLCAMSQKHHLTHVILFTVNYCLFANDEVSIRFNGKDDNVMLDLHLRFLNDGEQHKLNHIQHLSLSALFFLF